MLFCYCALLQPLRQHALRLSAPIAIFGTGRSVSGLAVTRHVSRIVMSVTSTATASIPVVQDKSVVTAPAAIVPTAATAKHVAIRAIDVVLIQVPIAAILMKVVVREIAVPLVNVVMPAHV